MASNTMASWRKRKRAHKNMGRKRKNRDARHSTPSATQLFAGLGEPGKPVPSAASLRQRQDLTGAQSPVPQSKRSK